MATLAGAGARRYTKAACGEPDQRRQRGRGTRIQRGGLRRRRVVRAAAPTTCGPARPAPRSATGAAGFPPYLAGSGHHIGMPQIVTSSVRSADTRRNVTQSTAQARTWQTASVRSALARGPRSEEHTSELQSRRDLVCRLLLEKKKKRETCNSTKKKKKKKNNR